MSIFIAIEGPECGGKSTQISLLADYLKSHNLSVTFTREPGGTPVGEAVREIFLDNNLTMTPMTEVLLMLAQRRQHWDEIVSPALDKGDWVISDRYHLSTIVYQGYGRQLPLDTIKTLAAASLPQVQPDMTLVLDLPAKLSLERLTARGSSDRLESGEIDFYERIRDGFVSEAHKNPINHRVIDATQSIEKVAADIQDAIQALL